MSSLEKAKRMGELHGCWVSRNGPKISCLLFADDSFFFSHANEQECRTVKNILATYEVASG